MTDDVGKGASSSSLDATMSLALRLEHISHAVYGDTAASTTSALRGGTNVLARINAVLSGLDAVQKHNKPVHQFLTSWDDNIDLLHPLSGAARATPVEEWDVATKVHYLLAMYPDIVAAADDLGKIDALVNQRDVPGASNHGGNKHIQRTVTDLAPLLHQLKHPPPSTEPSFQETQHKVLTFIAQYNEFTITMSKIFVALDEQVLALEKQTLHLLRQQA